MSYTEAEDRVTTSHAPWSFSSAADPEPWKAEAVCAQTDPDAFFPEKGGTTRDAKRICYGCPVIDQCLDYALEHEERYGIWGGFSERERRRIKRGEPVKRSFTNKPNRRVNGHGHACKCLECAALKAVAL
jgi:WhiB family redox-sensing transcriptional regulator